MNSREEFNLCRSTGLALRTPDINNIPDVQWSLFYMTKGAVILEVCHTVFFAGVRKKRGSYECSWCHEVLKGILVSASFHVRGFFHKATFIHFSVGF